MTRDHSHPILHFYLVPAIVVAIAAATILSGCGFVSEGLPVADCTSSSSGADIPPRAPLLTTSGETSGTTDDSLTNDSRFTDGASEGSGTTEESSGRSSDDLRTTGDLTSESSSGEESSTGDTVYDAHHCDDTCAEEDRIYFDFAGNPTCYCALPCTLESDCDADQACNTLLDRCILSCANGPSACPGNTDPPMACGLVDDTPPYAWMCLWMESGE